MPSLSPHHSSAMPASPHGGGVVSTGAKKAPMMKRHSSQSSNSGKHGFVSPGSGPEPQPLRQHVKPAKHAKIVLPRNASSGRNLAKLARQVQAANQVVGDDDGRRHSRQRSHENDTEIRLPGSLQDGRPPPPMRRNLTSAQLPRNTSHTKLKKNLSHGQLTRLGSGRNLVGLTSAAAKGPPSPAIRPRNRRPKSADANALVMDLHQREVELEKQLRDKNEGLKKVGFAVGSEDEASDGEEIPQMDGAGLQEDEWTDQSASASASPATTRQNTASNSRRTSISFDKPPDRRAYHDSTNALDVQQEQSEKPMEQNSAPVANSSSAASDETDDVETPSSEFPPHVGGGNEIKVVTPSELSYAQQPGHTQQTSSAVEPSQSSRRNSIHSVKEHSNPTTKHLLTRSHQSTAPALVSNVNALDDVHSAKASPAPSLRSSRSTVGNGTVDHEEDELVSRFIPSASHPSTGSGGNTTMNTPRQGSFRASGSTDMRHQQNQSVSAFHIGPHSPGSTVSGSSGAATPALGISRTELRLKNEKFMADMEDAAAMHPNFPTHKFDRRNETLKSYLHYAGHNLEGKRGLYPHSALTLGPEIFQGRFKAVDTELKTVQKFYDPIVASLLRLQKCKDSVPGKEIAFKSTQKQSGGKLPISKSTLSLSKHASDLSSQSSPPTSAGSGKAVLTTSKSAANVRMAETKPTSKVTFSPAPPESREAHNHPDERDVDSIARRLWDSLGE